MTIANASYPELGLYLNLLNRISRLTITTPEFTFFDVGLRGHFENPTSELLSFFLNPHNEHGLGDAFFQGYLSTLDLDPATAGSFTSVQTEITTIENTRLDLVIITENYVIATECKIYHYQNNPFEQYKRHIQNQYKEQKKFFLVLCPDGKTTAADWLGLSYKHLTEHIRPFLADALLTNPLNKWALLGREFLLHLSNLGEGHMNLNESDHLLVENQVLISQLFEAQGSSQRKIQIRLENLKEQIPTPPHCEKIWIYNKTCLVFDFICTDPTNQDNYSLAIDYRLENSSWKLVLLTRN